MSFNIPDPQGQLAHLTELQEKFSFGKESNNLSEIKSVKPIFAFDYLSFGKSKYCFNSNLINKKKDYLRLLESLKKYHIKHLTSCQKIKFIIFMMLILMTLKYQKAIF